MGFIKRFVKNSAEKSKSKLADSNQKITNKTVEDFRQGVIEKGKKFKYPIQYEKHKVVINTTVVIIVSFVLAIVLSWWGLYQVNSSNAVLFKITQFLPLPVGKVDGQPILYCDYLAQYRSSLHYYNTKEEMPEDEESRVALQKSFQQQAFDNATTIALARKIATEKNIVVTKDEKQIDLDAKLSFGNSKMSLDALDNIMQENYGFDRGEYKTVFIDNPLLVRKVSFAIDDESKTLSNEIRNQLLSDGSNFEVVARQYADKVDLLDSGVVKHSTSDGVIVEAALQLMPGQIAGPIKSTNTDGYYFIKLVSKDDNTLRYQSILVRLTEFNDYLDQLRRSNKIENYLNVDFAK